MMCLINDCSFHYDYQTTQVTVTKVGKHSMIMICLQAISSVGLQVHLREGTTFHACLYFCIPGLSTGLGRNAF